MRVPIVWKTRNNPELIHDGGANSYRTEEITASFAQQICSIEYLYDL